MEMDPLMLLQALLKLSSREQRGRPLLSPVENLVARSAQGWMSSTTHCCYDLSVQDSYDMLPVGLTRNRMSPGPDD